ncbi:MAG: 50S ribosomal protein L9 [Rhodobacteraceae bacterium]|nr:50S ribosomal protein L9 [Paracoccaceae bacterium]
MDIILLERVPKLGQMGDVVSVKNGYARNFLLPQGKALRSSPVNLAEFESHRSELEARNLELRTEAENVAEKLREHEFVLIRSASDIGSLYGSVTTRDIAETAGVDGVSVSRQQIALERPIKTLGVHDVTIMLHPEVSVNIQVNVARSQEEAEMQARGEDMTVSTSDDDEKPANTAPAGAVAEDTAPTTDAGTPDENESHPDAGVVEESNPEVNGEQNKTTSST